MQIIESLRRATFFHPLPEWIQYFGANENRKMNILIVDDHPLMLLALQQTIAADLPNCNITAAESLGAALEALNQCDFELLILDLFLATDSANNPYDNLEKLRRSKSDLKIALISGADAAEHAMHAVALGAQGFISKNEDPKLFIAAIQIILRGGTYLPPNAAGMRRNSTGNYLINPRLVKLTARQLTVLNLLFAGLPNKLIAKKLDISLQTVKAHVTSIMGALKVENRTQVVLAVTQLDKRFPGWRNN